VNKKIVQIHLEITNANKQQKSQATAKHARENPNTLVSGECNKWWYNSADEGYIISLYKRSINPEDHVFVSFYDSKSPLYATEYLSLADAVMAIDYFTAK